MDLRFIKDYNIYKSIIASVLNKKGKNNEVRYPNDTNYWRNL
jgi:hypothetical protein